MNSSHNTDQPSAVSGGAGSKKTPANSGSASLFSSSSSSQPRRQSTEGQQPFSNLHAVKRNSGDLGANAARKQSLSEQSAPQGMLSDMWQK